jgi:acetylornithine/N-succinyldiaminopimelate aminotransferase
MGATLVGSEISRTIGLGEHGSTFGGGQVACAAAVATMNVIIREKLAQNAATVGKYIDEVFSHSENVRDVRGVGLLRGIKLRTDAKPVQTRLLERGIIVGTADVEPDILRLLPPLTIGKKEVDLLFRELEKVCGELEK